MYEAETCTVRKVDNYLESFEIWFWRRLEKMSDMKYYVLKEERNILPSVKRRKANWIGHILRRSFLLKSISEGKLGGVEVTGRQGRRCKQLLDNLKEMRGYWK